MGEGEWQPARPPRPAAAWEARVDSLTTPAAPPGPVAHDGPGADAHADAHAGVQADAAADADADVQPAPGPTLARRAGGALRRVWARASRAHRLGLTVGAVAVVTALVAGAGLAAQPRYDEPARPSMLVDDLRGEPTTTVWSTDLAAATTPGMPKGCAYFSRVGTIDGDALLSAQSTELSDRCGGSGGRLARVDGDTGAVRWSANVATALGMAVRGVSVTPDTDGRAATLTVEGDPGSTLARIDLRTGEVSDRSASVDSDEAGQVTRVEGVSSTAVLVSHQPSSRFGPDGVGPNVDALDLTRFELRPLDDLDTVTWQGDEPAQATVTLLDDQLYLLTRAGDGSRIVDATTGDEHDLPIDAESYAWPERAGDHVLVSFSEPGGQRLVAFSRDEPGTVDWSVDLPDDASVVVSDRCVTVTATVESGDPVVSGSRDSDRRDEAERRRDARDDDVGRASVACLSPVTGDEVWATTLPVASGQTAQAGWGPAPDAPFDEVRVTVSPSSSFGDETSTTTTFDARDGRVVFEATLPGYAMPIASGRTTVYALTSSPEGPMALVAFDRHGRRELWRTSGDDLLGFDFWGPHLVVTGQDGTVRRLADDTAVVGAG